MFFFLLLGLSKILLEKMADFSMLGKILMSQVRWKLKWKAEWLNSFLEKTFVGFCVLHQQHNRNELNRYCISCDEDACRYCLSTRFHDGHELLKIHWHVYQDVVPFDELAEYFDCRGIQVLEFCPN